MKQIKICTYNIGHGLYDKDYISKYKQNSFKLSNIFPRKYQQIKKNVNNQIKLINAIDADIVLIQETSKFLISNRLINLHKKFTIKLKKYRSIYAANNWIPFIKTGIETLSKKVNQTEKITIPFKFNKLINNLTYRNKMSLKSTFKYDNKELIIYNVHFAAFQHSSKIRLKQIEFIYNLANQDLKNNKCVIIGGDWNTTMDDIKLLKEKIDLSQWNLYFTDKNTCRDLQRKYSNDASESLDGFLCSKNIMVKNIVNLQNFDYSDHTPIIIDIEI